MAKSGGGGRGRASYGWPKSFPANAPSNSADKIRAHVEAGGGVTIATPGARRQVYYNKAAAMRYRRAGQEWIREDGTGYRIWDGRSMVYVFGGRFGNLILLPKE